MEENHQQKPSETETKKQQVADIPNETTPKALEPGETGASKESGPPSHISESDNNVQSLGSDDPTPNGESSKPSGSSTGNKTSDSPESGKITHSPEAGWSQKLQQSGEKIIQFFSRVPLFNRIPFSRVGPRITVAGTAVCALLFVSAIFLFAFNVIPSITNADSDVAYQEQKKSPTLKPLKLILTHEGKTYEQDLRELGYTGRKDDDFDQGKLESWLKDVKKKVDKPAVNAKMVKLGSPIQPEKKGILMDMKKMEESLDDLPTRINKPQEIPMVPDEPKVTTGDLKRVNGKRIGQYTTYFNAGNVNRTTNLRLSSNAINNMVLNPGETFSFNQTVGQRTPERGYKPATIIVQGEYSEGIGGGICQTSSTLYNSVDAAGLAITKRFSHSREVTYVPAGRDATVAWNGPDFGFRNNLSKPILIKTVMENGKLTVQVYSTPDAWHQSKDVQSAPTEVEDMTKDPDPENPSEELDQD